MTPQAAERPAQIVPPELLDRVPPHSLPAETALLGAILLGGREVFDEVTGVVAPEDFYRTANRRLFELYQRQAARGEAIDAHTVLAALEREALLQDVGGIERLRAIAGDVVGATNAVHYAQIVRDRAQLRDLVRMAADLQQQAYEGEAKAEDLLALAQQRLLGMVRESSAERVVPYTEVALEILEELDRPGEERAGARGLGSGIEDLDVVTNGFHGGRVTVIAGRTSMGKTALGLQVAAHVAFDEQVPTLVVSLEMTRREAVGRILAARSGVSARKIHEGRYVSNDDYGKLYEVVSSTGEKPLFVLDAPGLTMSRLVARVRREHVRRGVGFVVLDYLELLEATDVRRKGGTREQEVAAQSRAMKLLAHELEIPVVVLAQLNRQSENRSDHRPRLSDLRESGAIENDADVVLLLYRREFYFPKEKEAKGLADIIVAKNRSGPRRDVRVQFDEPTMRFADLKMEPPPAVAALPEKASAPIASAPTKLFPTDPYDGR